MLGKRLLLLSMVAAILAGPAAFAQSIGDKVDYIGSPRHLKIKGLKVKDDTLMALSIEIENTDNEDQVGYYRIGWFDESGFPVWADEAWKPILVHGGQVLRVPVSAPTPKARDFKVEFTADRNWSGSTEPASN